MLKTTTVNGCEVMDVDGITFVRSRSHPHTWYRTTYETCECQFFRYHPYVGCRHVRAVSRYNRLQFRSFVSEPCRRCGAETVPLLDDQYRWNWRCSDFRCQHEEPETEQPSSSEKDQ